jgi:hypothetical protein
VVDVMRPRSDFRVGSMASESYGGAVHRTPEEGMRLSA